MGFKRIMRCNSGFIKKRKRSNETIKLNQTKPNKSDKKHQVYHDNNLIPAQINFF